MVYEFLLEVLEQAKEATRSSTATRDHAHLATCINRGWVKLNEYYSIIDSNAFIYAAAALHPGCRFALFRTIWEDQSEWEDAAKALVRNLWQSDYKDLADVDSEEKRVKTSHNAFFAFRNARRKAASARAGVPSSPIPSSNCSSPAYIPTGDDSRDELEAWMTEKISPSDEFVTDLVKYWLDQKAQYPRLSRMALDILTASPMSAACERLFSIAGNMVSSRRKRLLAGIISACQCVRSWHENGLISDNNSIVRKPMYQLPETGEGETDG